MLVFKREGGYHEVSNPRDLAFFIFLESLQELCFEVLPDHHVLLALLLTEFHYRRRSNNGGCRRGGEHERATLVPAGLYTRRGVGGEAAGIGCANHVADGGSVAARVRRRARLDGTDWGERCSEGVRRGGGLVESAGATSVVHVMGRV